MYDPLQHIVMLYVTYNMLNFRVVSVPIYFVMISIAPKMYIDAANVVPKYTLCYPVVHGHMIISRERVSQITIPR